MSEWIAPLLQAVGVAFVVAHVLWHTGYPDQNCLLCSLTRALTRRRKDSA